MLGNAQTKVDKVTLKGCDDEALSNDFSKKVATMKI
jgi:hypothetical protein